MTPIVLTETSPNYEFPTKAGLEYFVNWDLTESGAATMSIEEITTDGTGREVTAKPVGTDPTIFMATTGLCRVRAISLTSSNKVYLYAGAVTR